MARHGVVIFGMLFLAHVAAAQVIEPGSKVVATGAAGTAVQGTRATASAGGTTAIVGGNPNSTSAGTAGVAATCTAPSITTQPQSQTVETGKTATLSVTATGTTPLSYQWYLGAPNSISLPVGTNSASYTTPPLTLTTTYWVQVSNACGYVNSATATVSTSCAVPSITAQPQSASIQSGQTTTLSVTATGTSPLSYQWYEGSAGDTSTPVGTSAGSFTTPALTATTSYWVRVSNSCGHADSATATVTVEPLVVWVPVASHVKGLNNSQWRTDLGLLNIGSVAVNVQIEFYSSSGVVNAMTSVAAGAQSILTDVVGTGLLDSSGSGAVAILSYQPLRVTSRTYNQVASDASCYANGTQGQDYPAVVASDGLVAGQSAYLAGLTENASYRTNIGVVNTGTGSVTVLVELYDGAGTDLGGYPVNLAAGQWAQATQPFLNVAKQSAMDRGYAAITVQTGSGVFALASVIDNITNDPTTVVMQR